MKTENIINFTHDKDANDVVGHGTFIAGIVGSSNPECLGIAPEAEIYVLKLFSETKITYTSCFLDAFNYVI